MYLRPTFSFAWLACVIVGSLRCHTSGSPSSIDPKCPQSDTETNCTAYECYLFSTCTSCVSSKSPCDWCVYGQFCSYDGANCCRNDVVVTGLKNINGSNSRRGPVHCPSESFRFGDDFLGRDQADNGDESDQLIIGSYMKRSSAFHSGKYVTVVPDRVPITTAHLLQLMFKNTFSMTEEYHCVFSILNKTFVTNATANGAGIECSTPHLSLLPALPPEKHSLHTNVSVKTRDASEFVSTRLTFFDCNTFTSCTSCLGSGLPCHWCMTEWRCTHENATRLCKPDFYFTYHTMSNYIEPSFDLGVASSLCPIIDAPNVRRNSILVPAGTKKEIRLRVRITDPDNYFAWTKYQYQCQFNIDRRSTIVNASRFGDEVYCEATEFQYEERAPITMATLTVWVGMKQLDNPGDVHLLIYRCRDMARSCDECLKIHEKFGCGWCSRTNSCEVEEQCYNGCNTTWLDYYHSCGSELGRGGSDDRITKIVHVSPSDKSPSDFAHQLSLKIENLPPLAGQFLCQFSILEKKFDTNALRVPTGLVCDTPPPTLLAPIMGRLSSVAATLSVKTSNCPEFVNTNFTFYHCGGFTSCISCTSSNLACRWCIDQSKCVHDAYSCSKNVFSVRNSIDQSHWGWANNSTSECPAIKAVEGGSTEILVSAGIKERIRVKVQGVVPAMSIKTFSCVFNMEGRYFEIESTWVDDIVVCYPNQFQYTQRAPNTTVTLSVLSDDNYPLDNPDNIRLVVYRCREMAKDWNECLEMDKKFRCAWCADTNSCEAKEECPNKYDNIELDQNYTFPVCPVPAPNHPSKERGAIITSVNLKMISISAIHTLKIVIENPPILTGELLCQFNILKETFVTNATLNNTLVICDTPRPQLLSRILGRPHNVIARLSVNTINCSELATTDLTFFDCDSFASCTPCVSSHFPCHWCLIEGRCVHNPEKSCKDHRIVLGMNVNSNLTRNSHFLGPNYCPAMKAAVRGSTEILVPAGKEEVISVKFHQEIVGTPLEFLLSDLTCQFNIEGTLTYVMSTVYNDTVSCLPIEFQYAQKAPNTSVGFSVVWNNRFLSYAPENLDNIRLVIYRCREMADSCHKCLAIDPKFHCGWCQSTNSCEIKEQCENHVCYTSWIGQNHSCSEDRWKITDVFPKEINIDSNPTVVIATKNLPSLSLKLLCEFRLFNISYTTVATLNNVGSVKCDSPRPGQLAPMRLTTKLSLRTRQCPEYLSTNITFFDCNTFNSCTSCISNLECHWCVLENKCVHERKVASCYNLSVVKNIKDSRPMNDFLGTMNCPAIRAVDPQSTETLEPAGTNKRISAILDEPILPVCSQWYMCQFNIEGRLISVNADVINEGTVLCGSTEFNYAQKAPNTTVTLSVWRAGSYQLENPDNIRLVIYKCREMADTWDECLDLDPTYRCGWCKRTNSCEILEHCNSGFNKTWIDWNSICSQHTLLRLNSERWSTRITSVFPKKAQINITRTLEIATENPLPSMGQFLCVFTISNETMIAEARRSGYGVSCSTPPPNKLTSVLGGLPYITAKLSLKMNNDSDFASTDLTFYDCKLFTSCTSCVSPGFSCHWCVEEAKCTDDVNSTCKIDVHVMAAADMDTSHLYSEYTYPKSHEVRNRGPKYCPTIETTVRRSTANLNAGGNKPTNKRNSQPNG